MNYVFFIIAVLLTIKVVIVWLANTVMGPSITDNSGLLILGFIALGYLAGISKNLETIVDKPQQFDIESLIKKNNEG
jgi:hypothetical protein